jgi:hypothetical protein
MSPSYDSSWHDFVYNLDQLVPQGIVGKGSYGEV